MEEKKFKHHGDGGSAFTPTAVYIGHLAGVYVPASMHVTRLKKREVVHRRQRRIMCPSRSVPLAKARRRTCDRHKPIKDSFESSASRSTYSRNDKSHSQQVRFRLLPQALR